MIAARYSAVCRLAKPSRADFDSMPLHTAVDQLDRLHNGISKSERDGRDGSEGEGGKRVEFDAPSALVRP